jgi:hypothetical protein
MMPMWVPFAAIIATGCAPAVTMAALAITKKPRQYYARPRDERASVCEIVLGLLARDKWRGYPLEHPSGVKVAWDGDLTLPNGTKPQIGGYYKRKLAQAMKDYRDREEALACIAGQQQFAENVIKFEKRRA